MPSILADYPVEIIEKIFSFLSPKDAEHLCEDPELKEFAFERRFSCILLKNAGSIVSSESSTAVPYKLLHELVDSDQWSIRRKKLRFTSAENFLTLNKLFPDVLSKFEKIEHVGYYDVYLEDVKHFKQFPNLDRIRIQSLTRVLNTPIELHPNLTDLGMWRVTFEKYPPGLVELDLCDVPNFNTASIPESVVKMTIAEGPLIAQDIANLPRGLTTFCLREVDIRSERVFDMSRLHSLKYLTCDGIEWDKLILPKNIVSLHLMCNLVQSITQVEHLKQLKSLRFSDCQLANSGTLDIHYPPSLRDIEFREVSIKDTSLDLSLDPWGTNWNRPKVVSFSVPSQVHSLVLTKKADQSNFFVHGNVLSNPSLRKIELNVNGIYHESNPDTITRFSSFSHFPQDLEELIVSGFAILDPEKVRTLRKLRKFVCA